MPLQAFAASTPLTIGVELELQLTSPGDFDLCAASPDLLHLLGKQPFPGTVSPEITESMIEVATSVHHQHETLRAEMQAQAAVLTRAAARLNVQISGGGTHPFQDWTERRIFPKPRFREVSALYGYLSKQFTVFGQHVHIGCASGDIALRLLHQLGRYVPHFIALSASSPFVQGRDTRFHSSRLNSVSAFPLSGRAPLVASWDEFGTYFEKMERTGVVRSMKDFYWDIRPKPEYGTIELRVCDTPLTVERAAGIAGYLQVLCALLLSEERPLPSEDEYLVYGYNRFQACRFGLDGIIVRPDSAESITIREDILAMLRRSEEVAASLDATAAVDLVRGIVVDGTDATWLRTVYAAHGSVEEVVEAAVERFAGGEPRSD
ncbi:MAG: YbdK family carboxylate-amine ligase [Gemmatimonadaceae bacterium]